MATQNHAVIKIMKNQNHSNLIYIYSCKKYVYFWRRRDIERLNCGGQRGGADEVPTPDLPTRFFSQRTNGDLERLDLINQEEICPLVYCLSILQSWALALFFQVRFSY